MQGPGGREIDNDVVGTIRQIYGIPDTVPVIIEESGAIGGSADIGAEYSLRIRASDSLSLETLVVDWGSDAGIFIASQVRSPGAAKALALEKGIVGAIRIMNIAITATACEGSIGDSDVIYIRDAHHIAVARISYEYYAGVIGTGIKGNDILLPIDNGGIEIGCRHLVKAG
jgi:hypothetical protein